MAQYVKDLVLSLQQLGLLLWCGFDPWPRSFHRPQVQPEKKKRKEKEEKRKLNVCLAPCLSRALQPSKRG